MVRLEKPLKKNNPIDKPIKQKNQSQIAAWEQKITSQNKIRNQKSTLKFEIKNFQAGKSLAFSLYFRFQT